MSFFGKNIKKIRSVKKLSQAKFAELFELTRASIGAYEEERAEPKTDTIIKIADYYGLSLDELLAKELTVNKLSGFTVDLEKTDLTKISSKKSSDSTNLVSKSNEKFNKLHDFNADLAHSIDTFDNVLTKQLYNRMHQGNLASEIKQLIALNLAALNNSDELLDALIKDCLASGISKEEIEESLAITQVMGGLTTSRAIQKIKDSL